MHHTRTTDATSHPLGGVASRRTTLLAGLALALVLAACSSPVDFKPATPEDLLATGAGLYASSCASCHGADLRGSAVGPSLLSIVYEPNHHSDASFYSAVANGSAAHHWPFGDMPAIPALDEDDMTAILAFVREEQLTQGFEPYPP